jgi:hypothetical protein
MLTRSEEINLQLEAAMALQKTFLDSVESMNEVELHARAHTHIGLPVCLLVSVEFSHSRSLYFTFFFPLSRTIALSMFTFRK